MKPPENTPKQSPSLPPRIIHPRIHQIYYLPAQLPLIDPAFTAYDNTANANREFAEYHIFEKEFNAGRVAADALTGYVSWKFCAKTRLAGAEFVRFIAANPGYDVYFVNPFPLQVKFFKNLWLQGEFYHPGILQLAQGIIRRAGYDIDLAMEIHSRDTALYCNYWVGTQAFWNRYMEFTRPIVEMLRSGLSYAEKTRLHSIADRDNDFSFVAFIIERLFTTLINYDKSIRTLAYEHSYADIRRKYGHAGAVLYKIFPDNSKILGGMYSLLRG
ncbi:MAG: hypothetical protein JSR44_05395 [Spirochaetes bacterium]|nr:hypothetical protein [Spirochaetota bacterium]